MFVRYCLLFTIGKIARKLLGFSGLDVNNNVNNNFFIVYVLL